MFSLIKRERAPEYIRLVVASFAVSVIGLRLYLYLFDYPQVGNSILHIDHMFWGGIAMTISSLLIITFSNTRLFPASAIFLGTGLGFFLDELGKQVSRNDDYFFRPVAPIIYTIFLFFSLVYIYIRKNKKPNDRQLFYYVLDDFKEVLDGDLDKNEKQRIQSRLTKIKSLSTNPELLQFAGLLQQFILPLPAKDPTPTIWYNLRLTLTSHIKSFKLIHRIIFFLLIIMLGLRSLQFTLNLLTAWAYLLGIEPIKTTLTQTFIEQKLIPHSINLNLIITQTLAEGLVGILSLAGIFLRLRKKKLGYTLLKIAIVFSLATTDVLGFYFNQFRQAIGVFWDLLILSYINFYERLFTTKPQMKQ
jgi:hypothetical protein